MKDSQIGNFKNVQIPSAATIFDDQDTEQDFETLLSTRQQKHKDIEFGFSRRKTPEQEISPQEFIRNDGNTESPFSEALIPPKWKTFHSSFLMRSNRLISREDDSEVLILDHDAFPQNEPQLPAIFTITNNLSPTMHRLTPIQDPNEKESL
jgi:hypothetical protein